MTRIELIEMKDEMLRLGCRTLERAMDGKTTDQVAAVNMSVFDSLHGMVCRELQLLQTADETEPIYDGLTQAIAGLTRWAREHPEDIGTVDIQIGVLKRMLLKGGEHA